MLQDKQNYLSVLSNYFTNVINIVKGIIKLSLLTVLKAFVFIMDSCVPQFITVIVNYG